MVFTFINPNSIHPTGSYSHAVRMGDLIFVAGQVPQNLDGEVVAVGDAVAQAEQVIRNMQAVLDAAGSGLDRVGKITVLTTSHANIGPIFTVIQRTFGPYGQYPANIVAVVESLAHPEWLVEIDAVAMVR